MANLRKIPREDIEAAFTQYDLVGKARFNEPLNEEFVRDFQGARKFWVRGHSKESLYFPRSIVASIQGKNPDSGWQNGGSCSLMHNSGYIIVDEIGNPVIEDGGKNKIPESKGYLLKGKNRIIEVAITYYVEPAWKNGEPRVLINDGVLAKDIGSSVDKLKVREVLDSVDFIKRADIESPEKVENDDTITFIYNLKTPTNLIYYGPPGTGKTYSVFEKAVRLCLETDEFLKLINSAKDGKNTEDIKNELIRQEYNKLVERKQIGFLTFHQSFSYEEFVEGLRPVTESEVSGQPHIGVGFKLEPRSGVLKRIVERARLFANPSNKQGELDQEKNIFRVSASNFYDSTTNSTDNSFIHFDWAKFVNLSEFKNYDEDVNTNLRTHLGDSLDQSPEIETQIRNFISLKKGDYIVIEGEQNQFNSILVVSGEYEFKSGMQFGPHIQQVKKIWYELVGGDFDIFYQLPLNALPIQQLDSQEVDWQVLNDIAYEKKNLLSGRPTRHFVLIIDEINRANFSKVFGELITLIEPDKRLGADNEICVELPYSKTVFGVPKNLHFLGTMNTADRSIAFFDSAFRRRFEFKELMPDSAKFISNPSLKNGQTLVEFFEKLNDAVEKNLDREHQIGHSYFMKCQTLEDVNLVMRDKIVPLLSEYFFNDRQKMEEILEEFDYDLKKGCFLGDEESNSGIDNENS